MYGTTQKENQAAGNTTPAATPAIRIQPKLSIGAVNDPLEHEADTMADKVMSMQEVPSVAATGTGDIQRKCAGCEEEEKVQRKPLASFIQRKESSAGTVASDAVSNKINASKGSGSNMDSNTQSFMQSRFGADFSDVKIHTGGEAIQMNRELNAKAFTVGNDIYFNEGQYNPGSGEGKHLLAHELTHTVQQEGKIAQMVQKLDHTADTGFRYSPPAGVTRSIIEIQAVVGTNPDGVYGVNTKIAVERYQRKLAAIGFYTDTIDGKWGTNTDIAHEAFATGPNVEREGYNCSGFAFKRYTFIGLPATRAIYAGMTNLSSCTDACSPWHHKFWMWEFDTFTENTRTGVRSATTHDFHTVGGQTNSTGADPSQVMSKDGPRPIVGPGTPISFKPLAREPVVLTDGSRHPFLVWNVFNIDQKCFCNENLP